MNPTSFVPTSARRLIRRTIELGGRRFKSASLLPFFEQNGRVRRILLITRDPSGIFLLPGEGEGLRRSGFGRVRFRGPVLPLEPIQEEDMSDLARLWHFDPSWILDEERFAGHWAREHLKATNCAGLLPAKAKLYFRRDLSRVEWITHADDAGGLTASRWDDSQLPVQPPAVKSRGTKNPPSGWVLDPIWGQRQR